jgi:hypothetical protein
MTKYTCPVITYIEEIDMNIHRFARMLLLPLLSVAATVWLPQIHAADAAKGEDAFVVTKTQKAQVLQVLKSVDAQITAGFKGQEKLKDEMSAQLKAIGALKNAADRNKAASAYQAKYKQAYSGVLAKSKVDLNALSGQLRAIFPLYVFKVTPELTIVGSHKDALSTGPAPPGPATKTEEIPGSEFETQKERSCGAIAGGDVTSSSDSITATALAAVAGGCSSGGTMSAVVDLPAERKSASISAEADLSADGFAVGILGTAGATASAGFSAICADVFESASVSVFVLAPVLWVASAEEELDGASRQAVAPAAAQECTVRAHSDASVISLIGESHSRGEVDRFEASVTVEQ